MSVPWTHYISIKLPTQCMRPWRRPPWNSRSPWLRRKVTGSSPAGRSQRRTWQLPWCPACTSSWQRLRRTSPGPRRGCWSRLVKANTERQSANSIKRRRHHLPPSSAPLERDKSLSYLIHFRCKVSQVTGDKDLMGERMWNLSIQQHTGSCMIFRSRHSYAPVPPAWLNNSP